MPDSQKGFAPVIYLIIFGIILASIVFFFNLNSRKALDETKAPAISQSANPRRGIKVGELFVDIPSDWNIYLDFTKLGGLARHLITSYQFESFEFPKKGEYALVIGIEDKNISSDLETYLKSKPNISENETLNKANNGTIYIKRDVGSEYFKKVGSTVLVIFVYDNGDQIIDSTEQKAIDSLSI